MAATTTEVSTTGLVDTKGSSGKPKRRLWTEALKRQIVAETIEPVASVSIVARRHDVNANQLFKWRREMAPEQPAAAEQSITMLPVEIAPEAGNLARGRGAAARSRSPWLAGRGCAFAVRCRPRRCGRWSSCCDDRPAAGTQVWLAAGDTDMRKGYEQPGAAGAGGARGAIRTPATSMCFRGRRGNRAT